VERVTNKVIVTGVGGRSVGAGILFALGTLQSRYTVISTDADPFSFGLYKAEYGYVIPKAGASDYCDVLNGIIKTHNVQAIFPGTIPEVEYLAKNREKIKAPLIMNLNASLVDIAADKLLVYHHLKKLGINTPETVIPDEVDDLIDRKGFPLIVKPRIDTGASRNVTFIANRKELNYIREEYKKENISYVFQEVIGTGEDEYTVGVLNDKDGNLIDSIVIHRKLIGLSLKEQRTINGKTYTISTGYSQGFIIRDEAISNYCEHVTSLLNNVGPLNLQIRVYDGKVYILEVHPRFSGTTPIRASAGFNEPDILFRNFLFGKKFGRLDYQYNVAAIRAFEHILVPLNEMKNACG
jgi:carbamoyl-phosphate synthase large subunit